MQEPKTPRERSLARDIIVRGYLAVGKWSPFVNVDMDFIGPRVSSIAREPRSVGRAVGDPTGMATSLIYDGQNLRY